MKEREPQRDPRRLTALRLGSLGLAAWLLFGAAPAQAGGMFFSARGARPLGRGGAFVAGADDLEAIYYNPAGLAEIGGISVLGELGFFFERVRYQRVDSGGNPQPAVQSDNQILPLPFIGVSWRPKRLLHERVTFTLAAFTPYTAISRYALDGPQRYSLVSLAGTAVLTGELAVAVRVTPYLYLGAGFQNLLANVNNTIVLSGCTSLNCAPEDPNFDSPTQVRATSAFTPSGNLGAQFVTRRVRAGVSFQLPQFLRARGTLRTRLPSDPQFDGAVVVGDRIDVAFDLPWVLRGGVEVRPRPWVRIEAGADYEAWQIQDKFRFTPRGVSIDNIVGVGRYDLGPLELNRSLRGTVGANVGGEVELFGRRLTLRAGYRYESSAVPDRTLTVLTPDGAKHIVTAGVSIRIWRLRLDAGYGHALQADRTVTQSESYQLQPIRPPQPVPVGNGTYHVVRDVLSVGAEVRF